MNSASNLLVTKHHLKTDGDLLNALVCLCVNKRFMKFLMANHKFELNHIDGIKDTAQDENGEDENDDM